MLEHSVYSVITPEGCAAILWRDAGRAEEAATAMKITAPDLKGFGLIDEIVPEPLGGAHADPDALFRDPRRASWRRSSASSPRLPVAALVDGRYEKFRNMGKLGTEFIEAP